MLLKAQLIAQYPAVSAKRPHEIMSAQEREIWSLIYRSHDLSEMLERLPELKSKLEIQGRRIGKPYLQNLLEICGSWTIYARYSTRTTEMREAINFLEKVRGLKEVLR